MKTSRCITLIGLPGSGKSTVGRQLARRLAFRFVDTDQWIEQRIGCSIREFFEREGEERFREVEAEVLAQVLLQSDGQQVVATGGGIVLRPENRRLLGEHVAVYLAAQPNDLFRRVQHDRSRPLLQTQQPMARLQELSRLRDPLYREVADFVVDTGRSSVSALVQNIIQKLDLTTAH